jgi:hypothetical protein
MNSLTMAGVEQELLSADFSEADFARRGKRGKKEKGGMGSRIMGRTAAGRAARIAGLVGGAAALRYGSAAVSGARAGYAATPGIKNPAIRRNVAKQASMQGVRNAVAGDKARIKGAVRSVKAAGGRARSAATVGAARAGMAFGRRGRKMPVGM